MAKRKLEVVETFGFLPLPTEVLTRKVASEWLREWAGEWFRLLHCGFEAPDEATRSDYGMFGFDFGDVLEAAVQVAATGRPKRLAPDSRSPEWREMPQSLARILAHARSIRFEGAAVDALSQHLIARLDQRARGAA